MEGEKIFDKKKTHRKPLAGRKADKKKEKTAVSDSHIDAKIRNPKAFAINSVVRAERKFRRTQDIETKKERVPQVDRTPVEPPPFIIAIVGPPKVGKSTLLQNLVKNFTRQSLSEIKGPVTIVSGKKRRLTIIECNNDINSMIDVAKVADLVLLLIDASFGFEMEIFEFLNICQVHGFPQIMGVLTHLDLFKNKNQLKKTKKILKHRFWTEVYPGSKLFYLSGYHAMTNSYPKNEIHNLARFISVMKFRQTLWRSEHAYVIADRMEDLTSPESIRSNSKVDRTICLYGFVHGTFLKPRMAVHIPGVGDYTPSVITALEDPCPLPMKERVLKRSLNEKEKLIYAPFSGVGGIVYDKDAVYIDFGGSHHHKKYGNADQENPSEETGSQPLVGELRGLKSTLDKKMDTSVVKLFTSSSYITGAEAKDFPTHTTDITEDREDQGSSEDEYENGENINSDQQEPEEGESKSVELVAGKDGRTRRKVIFANKNGEDDSGSEGDDVDDSELDEGMGNEDEAVDSDDADQEEMISKRNKAAFYADAEEAFYSRFRNRSIQKLVYDDNSDFMNVTSRTEFDLANCAIMEEDDVDDEDLTDCFVGGDYAETAKNLLDADDDEDAFGDFEELDGNEEKDSKDKKEEDVEEKGGEKTKESREEMKKKLKERFDMEYDDGGEKNFYKEWKSQVEEQAKVNRTFFENVDDAALLQDLQGLAPGSYVRVEIQGIPCEFVTNFEPQRTCPLIIGSLDSPNQETLAVVQARVKKHRWFPKILKTRDPIILSVGWRRFQTISLYSVHDHNMRNRMIKYTPEHLHCVANFFGPMTPQGTGILGIAPQGFDGFRITLTGTILDMDKSSELVKKLKLIGNPAKIFKKSAFIQNMFSSQLEVAKFIGAKIKTVSGVRGVIKRPLRDPPGAFRAAFEDKILPSDIIFCRTWATVDIPKFFLHLPTHIVEQPRLIKTLGQLKREKQLQVEPNPDHLYTPIERQPKQFKSLKIPKSLQEKLPYKDKPKTQERMKQHRRIAVIKEPHEREMGQFLKVLKTRMNEKESREKADKAKKAGERAKVIKKLEEKQTYRQKELRKKVFRTLGRMGGKSENKSGGGGDGGRNSFKKRR